ncbi:hypothetical protein PAXRUDRAFT_165398 [Paxillus rubicundulus Ve08.2h10]|uniref:Uncharacterized protein n=1 Tax=Paxillus rubicundulus Ve08.2h10 TaxID=930991 RepID=A0A0D0DBD9_9AGAM|nr:hypothetical protein PAXRUDRAFT_165398 [Paxillus rubicundulus Ve08.2h10]
MVNGKWSQRQDGNECMANEKWQTVNTQQQREMAKGKRQMANSDGHWQTANGELGMVHGEW